MELSPTHGGSQGSVHPAWMTNLKSLDLFRTVPRELTEQTTAGASISIISGLLIAVLFLSEFVSYLRVETRHEMLVEHPVVGSARVASAAAAAAAATPWFSSSPAAAVDDGLMKVNFNITVPRMGCAITDIAVQDVLGSNIDVAQMVHKFRTDEAGNIKFGSVAPYKPLSGDHGSARDHANEGCNLVGHLRVKRVPGNFHISSNAHPELLQLFFMHQMMGGPGGGGGSKGIGGSLNTSHIINDLYFGETRSLDAAVTRSAMSPLNGGSKWALASEVQDGNEKSYEYFIQVIPTLFTDPADGREKHGYQFVANSNEILGRFRMPSIFFRYDVQPYTVRFKQIKKSFAHFAVQCCAIIGGTVAVLGLINMAIKATLRGIKVDLAR